MLNADTTTTTRTVTPGPLPQRQQALKRANANRAKVAQLKRRLHEREVTLAEVILDPPPETQRQLLFDVLQWTPRYGRRNLRALNARAIRLNQLNLASELGAITDRQRRWLADQVADRG
jgi:hypothetical protein